MDEFKVLLQAVIDTKSIGQSDIAKIQKVIEKYHLNLTADLDKTTVIAEIKKLIPQLESELKKITGIDIKINDKDLIKAYDQVEKATAKAIKEEEKLIDTMERVRAKTEQARQAEEKRQQVAQARQQNKALEEEYALRQKVAAKASEINFSIDNGSYSVQIEKLKSQFQQYGLSVDEAEKKVAELRSTLSSMGSLSGENLITKFTAWEKQIKSTKVQLDQAKLSYDKFAQPASNEKVSSLIIRIQNFLSKNTAITNEARLELERYITELNGGVSLERWNALNNQFAKTELQMRSLGKLGRSLKDQLSQAASSFTQWISISSAIMALVYQLRRIPTEVVKVNSSIIGLTKVSNASSKEIVSYFDEAAESAKRLGSSISDVIDATADFSRLGYNLPDASELANIATLYKNVGDGIDIDEASSSIVSTMKAFKIDAEDAITIVDRFNEVGNNFAISSGGIGDALSRSASSLSVANNTLSESIGLITAANTVVQDTSVVGTALKTVSLRMTSTSAELEELGEDTEYACETLSDYRDLVMGLTHNKVDIIGDNGEYKSTFQMLQEISKVWQDMNSMEQSSLMKALFGVRQANVGASILENFQIAEEAMKSAENAAGSALKEQEEYAKGIQHSLDVVGAKFQELSNHVLDSSLLKGIVDTGGNAISVLDTLAEKGALLPAIFGGVGITAFIKNLDCQKVLKIA